jgi:diguanylate cyclase (GGDEF)-like protein/PAS domain S-box-containing protein
MGHRHPDPSDERGRDIAAAVLSDDDPSQLARTQLLIECTRAVLHARSDVELARTVCSLLVQPGLYAEACMAVVDEDGDECRTVYAGLDKRCVADPPRFWNTPDRESAFERVLSSTRAVPPLTLSGTLVLQLRTTHCTAGALAVSIAAGRKVEHREREQLQALASDAGFALASLRDNVPRDTTGARERRLRDTIEHAGVGITRIGIDGRFIEVNQKFCDMLGYTREDLVGRPTRAVTVPEDYGAGPAFRAQAQLGRSGVLTGEKRYVHKNGTHVWVRRTMSAARDENGTIRDTISIVEDITERKAAEEAARKERTLLRTIIDALPDYIYVKDAQGRLQLGNAAWLNARNLDAATLAGKTVFDVFPAALAQRVHDRERQLMESGETMMEDEVQVGNRDEAGNRPERWSFTTKVPMRDESGSVIGIVGISRDITARRRMERERAMEHGIARVLSESRSIEDTMPLLIRTICEAMGWVYGAHWAWDASEGQLRRAGWWCEFQPEFDQRDAHAWTEIVTLDRGGLLGAAWLDQRATWVSDIAPLENFRRQASCSKFGFRSGYAFPIRTQDEQLGVMEFFGRDRREPDEAMLEVSGAISHQIGQFIRRKQAEESLQESEQQLRAVFDNADVGIAMTALDMAYLRVNDRYCAIVGYTREELLSMRASDVNLATNVRAMQDFRERSLREDVAGITVEKQLVRKDGTYVWVSMATSVVRASDRSPRYFIAVIQDISESKRAAEALKTSEEQFRRLAQYDILTGLPNRALLYDRLERAITQSRRGQSMLAVLFIDIDRFKHVNDTLGHAAGDQLLKQISDRFSNCVRSEDTVGRLSGDEFAIVLSSLASPQDAATVAKKLVDALNRPFHLHGADLFVTASIGITVYPTDSTDQAELIRTADIAMYRAKERGRNNYQFYTPEMNRRTREMLEMEAALRRALERDELVLHYQPKISLATAQIMGVEALLRWQHPVRGLVPPGEFMPLLEETGLIVPAGEWVLHAVCRQINAWRKAGMRPLPVAINLSARQFLAPDLGETIRSALEQHGIEPQLLEIEITESSIMSDTAESIRTLEYLQSLGVKSAIDDFGTGYSSLGYLKRFPLRALKIDRTFVRDITTDPDDATITQAVISMAHSLQLKVIAEGVESPAQVTFLMRYGCDEVQGFLFSRPVPPEECTAVAAAENRFAAILAASRGAT